MCANPVCASGRPERHACPADVGLGKAGRGPQRWTSAPHVYVLRSNPFRCAHSLTQTTFGFWGMCWLLFGFGQSEMKFRRLCSTERCCSGTGCRGAGAGGLVGAPCAGTF